MKTATYTVNQTLAMDKTWVEEGRQASATGSVTRLSERIAIPRHAPTLGLPRVSAPMSPRHGGQVRQRLPLYEPTELATCSAQPHRHDWPRVGTDHLDHVKRQVFDRVTERTRPRGPISQVLAQILGEHDQTRLPSMRVLRVAQ